MKKIICLLALVSMTYANPPGGALVGEPLRPRVFICSDINERGGDADDHQSMISLLLFADVLDIVGISGAMSPTSRVIDAYEKDYATLKTWGPYPTAHYLRSINRNDYSTEARDLLIQTAEADDPRPLYVLVWGGTGVPETALKMKPSIKGKLRLITIWIQDVGSHNRIRANHPDVWWIENLNSFSAMPSISDKAWMNTNIRGHGNLGNYYGSITDGCGYCYGIREGDSPTFIYLLRGDVNNPDSEHWGGRYKKTSMGPYRWEDDVSTTYGVQSISKWREQILAEYAARYDRTITKGTYQSTSARHFSVSAASPLPSLRHAHFLDMKGRNVHRPEASASPALLIKKYGNAQSQKKVLIR